MGIFVGIQFLAWTVGGLYFSWNDLDEIHGDQFLATHAPVSIEGGKLTGKLDPLGEIRSLELRFLLGEAYYWINDSILFNTKSGNFHPFISQADAEQIAKFHLKESLKIKEVEYLDSIGMHHEVRGRPLPLWAIRYEHPENLIAYVSARDGSFQRVRHKKWRWFDWLWMLHTMDYQGRDDFNNWLLRIFSLLGLITILSGFVLYTTTSLRIKRGWRKISTQGKK